MQTVNMNTDYIYKPTGQIEGNDTLLSVNGDSVNAY